MCVQHATMLLTFPMLPAEEFPAMRGELYSGVGKKLDVTRSQIRLLNLTSLNKDSSQVQLEILPLGTQFFEAPLLKLISDAVKEGDLGLSNSTLAYFIMSLVLPPLPPPPPPADVTKFKLMPPSNLVIRKGRKSELGHGEVAGLVIGGLACLLLVVGMSIYHHSDSMVNRSWDIVEIRGGGNRQGSSGYDNWPKFSNAAFELVPLQNGAAPAAGVAQPLASGDARTIHDEMSALDEALDEALGGGAPAVPAERQSEAELAAANREFNDSLQALRSSLTQPLPLPPASDSGGAEGARGDEDNRV